MKYDVSAGFCAVALIASMIVFIVVIIRTWPLTAVEPGPVGSVLKWVPASETRPLTICLPVPSVEGQRFKFTVRSKLGQEVIIEDSDHYYVYKDNYDKTIYLEKKSGDNIIAQQDGLSTVILMPEEDWVISGTWTPEEK